MLMYMCFLYLYLICHEQKAWHLKYDILYTHTYAHYLCNSQPVVPSASATAPNCLSIKYP